MDALIWQREYLQRSLPQVEILTDHIRLIIFLVKMTTYCSCQNKYFTLEVITIVIQFKPHFSYFYNKIPFHNFNVLHKFFFKNLSDIQNAIFNYRDLCNNIYN